MYLICIISRDYGFEAMRDSKDLMSYGRLIYC